VNFKKVPCGVFAKSVLFSCLLF